jgi:hypothetical protein
MGGLFKGPNGKVSMMRLMTFMVCVVIMAVFSAHNIVSMIKGGEFISMGASEAMLLAGVLGAKAAQTFSENKKTPKKLPDSVMPNTGE